MNDLSALYGFAAGFAVATILYGILACWLLDREADRIARQEPRITTTPAVLREAKRRTLPYHPPGATPQQRAKLRAFQPFDSGSIAKGGDN